MEMQELKQLQRPNGFSLVEIIVTLVIIGVLATLGLTQWFAAREHALDQEAIANLKMLSAAEKLYKTDNGGYFMGTTQDLNAQLSLTIPDANWNYIVDACTDCYRSSATRKTDGRQWCMGSENLTPWQCKK